MTTEVQSKFPNVVLHLVRMVLNYFWSRQIRLTLTPPNDIFKETQHSYWFTSNIHSKFIQDWQSVEWNIEIFFFWSLGYTHCSCLSISMDGLNPRWILISLARRGVESVLILKNIDCGRGGRNICKCARHTTRMLRNRINGIIIVFSTSYVCRLIRSTNGILFLSKIRYHTFLQHN